MSIVIDTPSRPCVAANDEVIEFPPNGAAYWDTQSVTDDIEALVEHISGVGKLLERDLLGPEQIAANLARLHLCAGRVAVRVKALEAESRPSAT